MALSWTIISIFISLSISISLSSSSAFRGFRIPAEAGRYLPSSSGLVQRSVMPPAIAASSSIDNTNLMQADDPGIINTNDINNIDGSQGGQWLGLGKTLSSSSLSDDDDDTTHFTPYVSVGVLSNMQQFFDSLRTNLDSLEDLPEDEKEYLLGNHAVGIGELHNNKAVNKLTRKPTATEHKPPSSLSSPVSRPTATAAYLHALRSHRPSHKLRNFVAQIEPTELRGTNSYDPVWLWAGLGRRRR